MNVPSEFSVCGVCPSDRLKVPLSVQVMSDTSVSETDNSLHTVESSCETKQRQKWIFDLFHHSQIHI